MILESTFPDDRRVENEATSLIKGGHNVHLACFSGQSKDHYTEYKGIKIHGKKINWFTRKISVGALKFPYYFNFWKRYITSLIEGIKIDVIHIHDLPLIKPVYELQNDYNFKIVLDLHENWPGLLNISPHTKTFLGRILSDIK